MNNPFYEVMDEELRNQVEANGDKMITMDPQLSLERQIDQIHTMMKKKIDVLIVNPVDSRGLINVLKEAKQQGRHGPIGVKRRIGRNGEPARFELVENR